MYLSFKSYKQEKISVLCWGCNPSQVLFCLGNKVQTKKKSAKEKVRTQVHWLISSSCTPSCKCRVMSILDTPHDFYSLLSSNSQNIIIIGISLKKGCSGWHYMKIRSCFCKTLLSARKLLGNHAQHQKRVANNGHDIHL